MSVTLVIGTEKGGFVATADPSRRTWTVRGPLFKGWKVTASARTRDGEFLVATSSRVYGAAIHRSRDLVDFTQIEKGPAYAEGGERKLTQIWRLHADGDRIYAGVDTAGLFASDDGGTSWQPLSGLNDHPTRDAWFPGAGGLCAHTILVDPKDPRRVWCGISAVGAWRSEDAGATWKPCNRGIRQVIEDEIHKEIGFCVHAMVADPDDADRIWRQDHTGMYRSTDGGDSWTRIENGLASWFGFPVALDPHTKALFAFPMESDEYRMPRDGAFRVYRSGDGGDSWHALGEGLPAHPVYAGVLRGALAVDGLDPCGVYLGSTAGGVYASPDGGDTWQALPCTLPRVLSVAAYPGT